MGAWRLTIAVAGSLMILVGCRAPAGRGYTGPTDPIDRVISNVNANNSQIQTLRGEGNFNVSVVDNGHKQSFSGDLTLLYSYPKSIRFIGKDALVGPIMEVGSNDDRFWMTAGPSGSGQKTMWWGSHAATTQSSEAPQIPVRPDLLLEVLGIQPIDTDLLHDPAPVMRFNIDADAYMIVWQTIAVDRWVAQKEIWYDRTTKLPELVLLFDANGRVVLRAYLSDHQPVAVENAPKEQWPKVATTYKLYFPDTGTRVNFDLRGALALKRGNVPNTRSFAFPLDADAIPHVIQLDDQTVH